MKKQPDKIYLIGFMGCGKSYIGKQLAQSLGWDFIDMDDFLEAKEGISISQIFAEGGESLFRELERNYLHATYDFENTVVATGGGAPCFFDNVDWMNDHGTTIYLKTPVSILADRLKSETNHRPLLARKTESQLKDFISSKLNERNPFYQQAQHIFEYKTGKENAESLLVLLKK